MLNPSGAIFCSWEIVLRKCPMLGHCSSLRKDTFNVLWCCYVIKILPRGFAHADHFWMFFKSRIEIAQKIMHVLYSIPKTSLVLSLLIDMIEVVLVGWIIISLGLEEVLSPAPWPDLTLLQTGSLQSGLAGVCSEPFLCFLPWTRVWDVSVTVRPECEYKSFWLLALWWSHSFPEQPVQRQPP